MTFLKPKAGHTIFPLLALHRCFTTHGLMLFTCVLHGLPQPAILALLPARLPTPYSLWSRHTDQPLF